MTRRKLYRVVGAHAVDEHEPGEEFDTILPPEREQRLIRGGHIEVVASAAPRRHARTSPPAAHPRATREE
jgi:hypothetical protein